MCMDHIYLTRGDIAAELQISRKQVGRLMQQMRRLPVGARQYRVSRADFDLWKVRKTIEDALTGPETITTSKRGRERPAHLVFRKVRALPPA